MIRLQGTWYLVSAKLTSASASVLEDSKRSNVRGLLVYMPDGFMSIGVNSEIPRGHRFSKYKKDPIIDAAITSFSYGGRYRIKKGYVVHQVAVSSHPRILSVGSNLVRSLKTKGENLIELTAIMKWGNYSLTFKRASKSQTIPSKLKKGFKGDVYLVPYSND